MRATQKIPINISNRVMHFKKKIENRFSFLVDFNYLLEKIEIGRTNDFLNYYCNFSYQNGDTFVRIEYSTDIINGQTIAFPHVEQKPIYDNVISCFISDSNSFMSIDLFAKETQSTLSDDYFKIAQNEEIVKQEIARVVENYVSFFRNHLVAVLQKKKIYNCYIDRFYDKVFEEKHYR
jgi:hypothetical protein